MPKQNTIYLYIPFILQQFIYKVESTECFGKGKVLNELNNEAVRQSLSPRSIPSVLQYHCRCRYIQKRIQMTLQRIHSYNSETSLRPGFIQVPDEFLIKLVGTS